MLLKIDCRPEKHPEVASRVIFPDDPEDAERIPEECVPRCDLC